MDSRKGARGPLKSVRQSRGMTLIELLVAIGIVAIVSAIAITGLRAARESGRDIQTLANLRSSGQLLLTWSSEHQDTLFNVGLPLQPEIDATVYLESPDGQLIHVDYIGQWYAWTRLLSIWLGETHQNTQGIYYALGCITDPSLWVTDPQPWTRYPATDTWRVIRASETSFPSQKAMMFRDPFSEVTNRAETLYPLFFIDGSATSATPEQISPLTEGFYLGRPAQPPRPGQDTIDGVHGRDIIR